MLNSSFARKISSVSIAAMIFVSACGERDSGPQASSAHSPSAAERSAAQRPLVLHVQSAVGRSSFSADSRINSRLNTPMSDEMPAPKRWHLYSHSGHDIRLTVENCDSIDVLEFVAYPQGLNTQGIPKSHRYGLVCGPEEGRPACKGQAAGSETKRNNQLDIASTTVQDAVSDSTHFAIAGICIQHDTGEDLGFIFFFRKAA